MKKFKVQSTVKNSGDFGGEHLEEACCSMAANHTSTRRLTERTRERYRLLGSE